jgi:hypothetical protein
MVHCAACLRRHTRQRVGRPMIARSRATTAGGYGAMIARSVIASGAKQSILPLRSKDGLLRGACHRARIRATRWLAMTSKHTFATPPRHAPEPLINLSPKEGVGNAGCPLHPRPRVHLVVVERTRVTTAYAQRYGPLLLRSSGARAPGCLIPLGPLDEGCKTLKYDSKPIRTDRTGVTEFQFGHDLKAIEH